MARIERQTTLEVAAEKAFSYLSDIPKHSEWAGDKLEIEPASQGPLAVGSAFSCIGHQMGTHHGRITITELVPNEKLVFESDDNTGRFRHGFIVQNQEGKTVLIKSVEPLEMRGPLRIIGPIAMGFMVPRAIAGDLKRIKARLEGESVS